ncbi:hypothetical protein [Natronomonas sp.]|uniref:hypothetical protein n=1 Tax=Natronomonas sp. TaxID=2184060 RepID=UPI00261EBF06|nr:hypothetical protein [Natronomonas sp.]
MNALRFVLVVALVVSGVAVAVPAAGDVPDARIVVSDVSVSPTAPEPQNTTTVEFTVENSAGSATGVALDRVALEARNDDAVYAEASGLGSLSVGDDVTLELTTAFETAGVRDLALVVETDDEDGTTVTATRPVTVVVGGVDAAGVTDDVQVDARTVDPDELEEDEQPDVGLSPDAVLGGNDDSEEEDEQLRTSLIRVEVTNFGTATARDVTVAPTAGNESLPRLSVPNVAAGETESVLFDAGAFDEPTRFGFEAAYTLGTDRSTSDTTLEYRPNRGEIVLTDIDVTFEDGTVTITGNAANRGLGEVNSAIVAVEGTEHVSPAYPARNYFVGTVPESEFVRFDLTADVDRANATAVPVTVTYLAGGEPYERTVELPIDGAPSDTGDDSGVPLSIVALTAVSGSVTLVGGAALGWRRSRGRD